MTSMFIVLQTNTLVRGEIMHFALVTNILALETNALKVRVRASAPHSYTYSYQQFSSRTSLGIATHRHSPSKTGGSHALVLTCKHATPTSYICNSVLETGGKPGKINYSWQPWSMTFDIITLCVACYFTKAYHTSGNFPCSNILGWPANIQKVKTRKFSPMNLVMCDYVE